MKDSFVCLFIPRLREQSESLPSFVAVANGTGVRPPGYQPGPLPATVHQRLDIGLR